jgi:hypothetical protein
MKGTIYCRADKGYAGESMYSACEEKMIGYAIKIKKSNPLFEKALQRHWCRIHEGTHIIEYTEFEYQANGWSIPRCKECLKKCFCPNGVRIYQDAITSLLSSG